MILLAQKNDHRFGNGNPAGWFYASCIGWTAPNGTEYAVIGFWNGTAIYNISDSSNVYQCDTIPGPTSFYGYREFTIIDNYLYIVSEGTGSNQGLQIVNLQYLPDSVHHVRNWTYGSYNRTHTIKSSGNFLFLNGANVNGGGIIILDVTDRENPVVRGSGPQPYSHDCFIKNDTLYAANIYSPSRMSIINVTDKDNPTLITQFVYSNAVCHNIWTSNDRRWLLTTDEGGSNHLKIWNAENLSNITFVYEYLPYQIAMVHNAYFKGDTIFMSHYRAGVVALDVSNLPAAPTVIGYYDTYPDSGTAYQGAWNVYPFYNSGKFIVSDINTGLYVFRFGSPIGIHQSGTQIPKNFKLEQNYPNPFNPTTRINFELPDAQKIDLNVYDITGRLIRVLYSGYLTAGKFSAKFDSENLSSGVYFYSLISQSFKESKKMILTK
jgi:choice-of-anchor B domain-containing protein